MTRRRRKRGGAGASVATGRGRWLALAAGLAALAGVGVWLALSDGTGRSTDVLVPDFTPGARAGQAAFDRHCAACHGPHASGTALGPPLVHAVYRPGHHADAAFVLAVRRGVRAHHWRSGDMPPMPGVGDDEIAAITRYVRELQRANGID